MHGMVQRWRGGPYIVVVCTECQGGDYACVIGLGIRSRTIFKIRFMSSIISLFLFIIS